MEQTEQFLINNTTLIPRLKHILQREGIFTIEDLMVFRETVGLASIYQIGEISIAYIEDYIFTQKYIEDKKSYELSRNVPAYRSLDQIPFNNEIKNLSIRSMDISIRAQNCLLRSKIYNIGDLLQAQADDSIASLYQVGEKTLDEITTALDRLINSWPNEVSNKLPTIEKLTWSDIIIPFFDSLDSRDQEIFFARYGLNKKTLQELASEHGITRERIRQIQGKLPKKFIRYTIKIHSLETINEINKVIDEIGDDISIKKLQEKLNALNLLYNPNSTKQISTLPPDRIFESLICWLTMLADNKVPKTYSGNLNIPKVDLHLLLQADEISIKNMRLVNDISLDKKRKIRSRLLYTAGINLSESQRILGVPKDVAVIQLGLLNLTEIIPNWYSFVDIMNIRRDNPVRTAGLKMLSIVEKISIDDFFLGLSRRSRRKYSSIAPIEVITHVLKLNGFSINEGMVSYQGRIHNALSISESVYVEALEKYGGVANALEIVEFFVSKNLSVPAAFVTLHHSPIAERIDFGFYHLRGVDTEYDQIVAAKQRQKKVSQREEIHYGLDGVITLTVTLSRYIVLSGVLSATKIKDLKGQWTILDSGKRFGQVTIDDSYLWGLNSLFNKLTLKPEDRIELTFNTWTREMGVKIIK